MKMISATSLEDCNELRKLIMENPDLPLLVFCSDDANSGDYYYYELAYINHFGIEYLTLYNDIWLDEDDYEEKLYDDLADEEEYKDLSDEEYDEMIKQKVRETEFVKAIVLWIG